ncbi:MAG: carbamoyl-phosphate synthase large subunit [Candidatus Symbiobacter sp.]|nr:carbamoyl-phosphate synthase large subunit [Candidatus Symbiobacter sp.]
MPKRHDINSILIIGAGPIVIGQACEFDYSGVQACKALREEGYRVVLINSNPATIMTDPDLADATYIEPITPDFVEQVLRREKIDAILPTMGGQTALNTALALAERGVLARMGVELIGANEAAIKKAEDRQLFRDAMEKIGLSCPRSVMVHDVAEGLAALDQIGLPAILRPSFTLGGQGGGIAWNREEFTAIVSNGLRLSPSHSVLVEESVLGWKEFEMEVVRDRADNCIIVCSIENFDPMGVHTGDSITVAPALTLTDKEYQIMRDASIACLREIGVDTGGSNVQFALNPENGRLVVIEMNPRVSRSSALASKATGFPIAKVAAKLAVGYTLDELANDITRVTPASFEPTLDYIVTKIPRFTFEKFPGADTTLTTSMKSVGEVMAIGRNFAESLQKALCGLETGLSGLNEFFPFLRPQADNQPSLLEGIIASPDLAAQTEKAKTEIRQKLGIPTPERILLVADGFRVGMNVDEIYQICKIDRWFLRQIFDLVAMEQELSQHPSLINDADQMMRYKSHGFSDKRLAQLTARKETEIFQLRDSVAVHPVYKRIDSCAAEFASVTSYFYSTYEPNGEDESDPTPRQKVMILGGGPNRIGQGIEFDYCCVHAAYALRDMGLETIMVNCNPETVSTDYDTSDRLYFEPLTAEHVIAIARQEQKNGTLLGAIVQFGGQTPLKLAHALEQAGIPILGTSVDAIDLAEDRERFQALLTKIGQDHPKICQPHNGTGRSPQEVEMVAEKIGYPVVLRPSYVLGGRAMEIVHDRDALRHYTQFAVRASGDNPVLVDSYLRDAIEVDVDALVDREQNVYVAGIMEHIEEAGIHSGDSACCLPPYSLPDAVVNEIAEQTRVMGRAIGVVGLMNVQFAVQGDKIWVLEVNPRASRTVPFVAKATNLPIAKIAAQIMAGGKIAELVQVPERFLSGGGGAVPRPPVAVKEAVFPFARFPGVDIMLGPEMKSTGEVMGLDDNFARAFAKAQIAAGLILPTSGTCFLSVKDSDKAAVVGLSRDLLAMGFKLLATRGTAAHLLAEGLPVTLVYKVAEGRPNIVDEMISGHVQLLVNTVEGRTAIADSVAQRRTALTHNICYYTTLAGAKAAIAAIQSLRQGPLGVASLQSYFTDVGVKEGQNKS